MDLLPDFVYKVFWEPRLSNSYIVYCCFHIAKAKEVLITSNSDFNLLTPHLQAPISALHISIYDSE
jgi:hypothetical protein